MKCPECGFQLAGTETLCPRCLTPLLYRDGQPVVAPVTQPEPESLASTDGAASADVLPSQAAYRWEAATEPAAAPSKFYLILTVVLAVITIAAFAILIASATRSNAAYYWRQAQAYYQNEQYENALIAYLRVLEQDGSSAAAKNGAGWSYLKMNKPSQAIVHLRQAVETDPNMKDAHLGLGIAYSLVGMYPEAEASLKKVWEIKDPAAGSYLGYIYYQEQRYEEAIAVLQAVTKDKPQDGQAQEYLGRSFYALKRYDEALAPLRLAVESNPASTSARHYLGLVGYELGRCDWAVEQFQALQAVDPQNPAWYVHIGKCLLEDGQTEQAAVYLNHALTLNQGNVLLADSYLLLGQAYYERELYDQAVVFFQRALIMRPDSAPALAGTGLCYAAKDRCEEARPLFEQALAIDPYLESAQEGLQTCPEQPERPK